MRNLLRASAAILALGAVSVALGQTDTTTSTNLFSSLGLFAPILIIIWAIIWGRWGGFRLLFPG